LSRDGYCIDFFDFSTVDALKAGRVATPPEQRLPDEFECEIFAERF
jgi:hypothetical protein